MGALTRTVLTACALALAVPAVASAERIRIDRVRGFVALDDQHVLLRLTGSKRVLITLRRPCQGFGTATRITASFGDHTTIAAPRQEWLSAGRGNCLIADMEMVADRETAVALIAERAEEDSD